MSDMNMKYLRSFLAYVEERSAAKAAHRLGIPRHNIVPHVAAVEKAMGEQLLETRYPRNPGETGRTQLTEAGQAFLPRAIRAMQAHDAMFDPWAGKPDPRGARLAVVGGLLELALDAARNNLSDADEELLNAILVKAELETLGVPAGRLRRNGNDAAA